MGEETKAREKKIAHARRGRRRRRRRRKKRSRNGATRPACFRASPGAVGKLLFSAPSVSLAHPFLVLPYLPREPHLVSSLSLSLSLSSLRVSSRDPHPRAVDSSFISLLFFDLSSSLCIRGPSISSPRVSRYPEEKEATEGNRKKNIGRAGVPAKCEIRVCQNERWRFSLKSMGEIKGRDT